MKLTPTPDGKGEEGEEPYVRGPEEVGVEDMGPQGDRTGLTFDLEKAVGRKVTDACTGGKEEGGEGMKGEKRKREEDGDGDGMEVGADRKPEGPADGKISEQASQDAVAALTG